MVARALLAKPRLIIADEPVSMVDASLRATILGSLRKLNQEFGISLMYITHDLTTAYQISQNIIVLYGGSVKAGNVAGIMAQTDVDGALVGGASIDPDEFVGIVRYRKVPEAQAAAHA